VEILHPLTVPPSGFLNIEVSTAGGPTDWAMELYSGPCGALTQIECDDDDGPGFFPTINATGLTPGDQVYLRVWEWGNNLEGEFNICAFAPAIVCDLTLTSETVSGEICPGVDDGTITLAATTTFGPISYSIAGPVSMTNMSGSFTGLPQGSYTYTITDTGFPGMAACELLGGPLVIGQDSQAPIITCPPGTVVDCNSTADVLAATSAAEFMALGGTIMEDCEVVSVTSEDVLDGDICPTTAQQTISRVYTVTDDSGNSATCAQTITILNSTIGPVITSIPLDQTVDCAVNALPQIHLFQAEADCGGVITTSVTEMPVIGTPGCNGSRIQFMYTATDGCGRTASHIQSFTLLNEGPTFVCPTDLCIIDCPADDAMILEQFNDYAELATVLTSCSENDVTITNSFNMNFFIPQNCQNPFIQVPGALEFQTVTFRATDFCGRQSTCTALVVIRDASGPEMAGNVPLGTANCATPNLQAGYDAWIDLALSNLSATDECSNSPANITYAPMSPNTDCSSGLATTDVTFTATDICGNESVTNATYQIIDFGSIPTATVSGSLRTEENEAVELVEVAVDGGSFNNMMLTSSDGDYAFDLELNQNHAITPSRNDNPLNGVTSYDLILMGQHLLEIQTLDSPYKLIAADVNNSGSITSLDLIQLRKLILHLDDEFINNTSWRFVDANYSFVDVTNPFTSTFPEAVSINNLSQVELHDFVAIKVGDLNGSAAPILLGAEGDTRDRNDLVFQVQDQQLSTNQTYTVDFNAKDFNNILGYQFSLAFDNNQLELVDFEAGELADLNAENFGIHTNKGVITSSWNVFEAISIADDATLFSITFKANANVNLSEAISFNSQMTSSEAYNDDASLMNLGLEFNASSNLETPEFALLQNRPNPFNNETLIAFTLPESTTGTVTIYDVAGRVLKQYEGDFNKGFNEITVNRSDLSGSGLIYYQLETSTDVATMKMIVQ